MELNVRKSRIRNRCPRMKRVPGRSRFTFRCHRATNKERERERERVTRRKVPTQIKFNKIKKKIICMNEHETCKSKNIMGSAQFNPTNTHDFNIVHTQI